MAKTPKPPSEELDKFLIRMPTGLRDRIKAAADRQKRSMNAEIIDTLENQYPEPITIDEVVEDIEETVKILQRFGGKVTLMHLADRLDELVNRLSVSKEGTAEDREAASKHIEERGKFVRFVPPDGDF